MTRRTTRRALALVAVLGLAVVAVGVQEVPRTDAAWTDAERATGGVGAVTLTAPLSQAQCVYTPGLLGLTPSVTLTWKLPASAPAAATWEFGYVSGGLLLPITGSLLGSVQTTGTQATGYTTTFGSGLLGALLGGKIVVGIRTTLAANGATTWTSPWLTGSASAGIGGSGATCAASDR